MESIKDATKRETEELKIERINKLKKKTEEIKTAKNELRIKIKFNELRNNLDIRLLKETKNIILNIVEYIADGEKPYNKTCRKKNSLLLSITLSGDIFF